MYKVVPRNDDFIIEQHALRRKESLTILEYREEGTDWHYPVIHIIPEDKKLRLAYHFDRDMPIGTHYIKQILLSYNATRSAAE